MHYDYIRLEKEDCTENCELLHLSLKNLSYDTLHCPYFEFRLSCAGLQSSDFGNHPRLEFPASTRSFLKSWFDNSVDPEDFMLELRFKVPDAMDLDVWGKFSKKEAGFISMLVQYLPLMLKALRDSKVNTTRSWDEWLSLADDVKRILLLHITPLL